MAISSSNPKHVRSISLPSSSHPLTQRVEEQLYRLKSSEATSSSSVSDYIGGLNVLYESVHYLIQSSQTQQTMARGQSQKWVDETLDGSLRLVDACATIRDALIQFKESLSDLQSSLGRRGVAPEVANAVRTYISRSRKIRKEIRKGLVGLKKSENKPMLTLLDKDQELVALVRVFREIEAITICMFESVFAFISGQKTQAIPSGWSLVSKLMRTKRVPCENEQADASEAQQVYDALNGIIAHKSCKGVDSEHVQNAQVRLEALASSISDLEDGLECTYRHLIKRRVSLLNTVNH